MGLLRAARAEAGRHPRHLLLLAALLGVVASRLSAGAVVAASVLCAAAAPTMPLTVGAASAAAVMGAVGKARAHAIDDGPLEALHGSTVRARATVLEPPRRRVGGVTVARVKLLDGAGAGDVAVLRARRPLEWPPVGHEVQFAGAIGPLDGAEAWQRRRGAHALIDAATVRVTGGRRGGPAGVLDAMRDRGLAALGDARSPDGALLRGMVLGADDDVPDRVRDAFSTTSLAHLLAVSGQNVVLLATLVMAAAAAAGLRLRGRLAAALVCVAAYVPLTGAGPSIQRAGIMGGAGLVAALAGRHPTRWYALGLTALVTLAWNPHTIEDVGWQLSFAAVVALLIGTQPLAGVLRRRGVPAAIADAVAVTLAATLGTAPLIAAQFDQISTVALPANLLAAPAVAPVMWIGMVAAAVAQVDVGAARVVAAPALVLVGYIREVAETLARVPGAAIVPGAATTAALATLSLAGLAALAAGPQRVRKVARSLAEPIGGPPRGDDPDAARSVADRRRVRPPVLPRGFVLLGALAAAAAIAAFAVRREHGPARLPAGEFMASFLDIGQGDATLLRRGAAAVLVDTGPPDGPILRRLREEGVRHLDALVLTHAQTDHEGAALDVIRAFRPRLVLNGGDGQRSAVQAALDGSAAAAGARVVAAHAGEVVRLGGMTLRVLWPPPRSPGAAAGDPNDRAVVALVRSGAFDLLLPADAESNVTAQLAIPPVDALKVAHHGSADEGLARLLARIHPSIAAIPVGRGNTYGHPAPSTVGALRAVPEVLRTDRDGTVRVRVDGARMTIERAGVRE